MNTHRLYLAAHAASLAAAAAITFTLCPWRNASAESVHQPLPIAFIENAGQSDPKVCFQAETDGASISIGRKEVEINSRGGTRLLVRYEGANAAELRGQNALPGVANIYPHDNPETWRTGLPTYAGVELDNLYPGIRASYDGGSGSLKTTYFVSPGADAASIRWSYDGAEQLQIRRDGALSFVHDGRSLSESAPIAWQEIDGRKVAVEARYEMKGRSVAFAVGVYDKSHELVIDPYLHYAAMLEGEVMGVAADRLGNSYVVTPGLKIRKLNSTGTSVLFTTTVGMTCSAIGIGLDESGNIYAVGGWTDGATFPATAGAFQGASGGRNDFVICKLSPAGALSYATYLGGPNDDWDQHGVHMCVDSAGNVYGLSETSGGGSPVTAGAYQSVAGFGYQPYLFKMNPSGTALVYGTYFGTATLLTYGYQFGGVTADASGNAYVTGTTLVSTYPTTPGAFQSVNAGDRDIFVSKFNPAGSALVYSTYIGGLWFDHGRSIAVDPAGNAYLTGYTESWNFPVTPGAYRSTITAVGDENIYLARLNATGTSLTYGSYIGQGRGAAVRVDSAGVAYVYAWHTRSSFPTTASAFNKSGSGNTVLFRFDPATSSMLYSTFLGATTGNVDQNSGDHLALDGSGTAIVAAPGSQPVTPGAVSFAGGNASFICRVGIGIDVKVNFQPAAGAVPTGYLVDSGAAYGNRGDWSYGWEIDNSSWTRDRNAANSPDQRYDTLTHMQKPGSATKWELGVPNGTYTVKVTVGDPLNVDSVYGVNVEGVLAVSGTPTTSAPWFEREVTVTVTDGRITLTNAPGSSNNKLCFVTVTSFAPKVNFQVAGAPIPAGYLADNGAAYGARGGGYIYGWNIDNLTWGRDRNAVNSPDQRFDTLTHTQKSGGATSWDISLPNGVYTAHLVAGDPSNFDSVYKVNLEGQLTVSGTPNTLIRWFEGVRTVTVSDGKLTLTSGAGASNNKICFLEIVSGQ